MDGAMSVLSILILYGWPFLVGIGCYVGSTTTKIKSGLSGLLKGSVCLLLAISLSWLATAFSETWVMPQANSLECMVGLDSCTMVLLDLGDWIETWNFILLEICAVLVAVNLVMKQVKHLTKTVS